MRMPTPALLASLHFRARRILFLGIALALTLSTVLIGCSDDSTTEPGNLPADFSGSWAVSGEVISKRVCDNEVGTTRSWDVVITQEGNIATFSFDGGSSTELTVVGSTATGEKINGEHLVFALTILNGELGGTITALNTALPCEEVWTITGTRKVDPPSEGFGGFWNIDGEFITNECGFGNSPECTEIIQDGDMVSIPSEGLEGTVVGNTATMFEEIVIGTRALSFVIVFEISSDGNSLTGTNTVTSVDTANPEDNCISVLSLTGTRTEGCAQKAMDHGMMGVVLDR